MVKALALALPPFARSCSFLLPTAILYPSGAYLRHTCPQRALPFERVTPFKRSSVRTKPLLSVSPGSNSSAVAPPIFLFWRPLIVLCNIGAKYPGNLSLFLWVSSFCLLLECHSPLLMSKHLRFTF